MKAASLKGKRLFLCVWFDDSELNRYFRILIIKYEKDKESLCGI